MRKLIAILAASFVAALVVSVVSLGQSSGSAAVAVKGVHWTPVHFTEQTSWADGWEHLIQSKLPGCETGDTVATSPSLPDQVIGDTMVFKGSKVLSCADGELTLVYRAFRLAGAKSTFGSWMVTGGEGRFERLNGSGQVEGRYTFDSAGSTTGIIDRYDGVIWLP